MAGCTQNTPHSRATRAQQGQQEDEAEGKGATANKEQHVQKEKRMEKGEKRMQEENRNFRTG